MSTVVGIDLGGTKVAAALLSAEGGDANVADSVVHPTVLSSTDALLDQLVAIVAEAASGGSLDAVGIGVPSVVEFATGRVVSSVNIPLANVPLRAVLGERLGVPVFIDNDATVAALAEAHDESMVTAGPIDPNVYATRPEITLRAVPASKCPLYSENSAICGPYPVAEAPR